MPAPVRTSRETWVDAGLRSLAEGGPDAVRIETLATSLGVSKGGFYWHFAHRQALLDAMLAHWEDALVDRAIEAADRGGGDARARLRRLFAVAGALDGALQLELSMREWSRRDPAAAAVVTRVDNRRMAYLRPLFAEIADDPADAEGRCLLVLTLFVGESSVTATHGRRTRPSVMAAALRHLLR